MGKESLVLVDTDILIKEFRGNKVIKEHLDHLIGRIAVSIITVIELFNGIRSKKQHDDLIKQFKSYHVIHIDSEISREALYLIKSYSVSNIIKPPDCFIAATSIKENIPLYTDNKKHFQFIKKITFYTP